MEATQRRPPDFFTRPGETLLLFAQLLPGDFVHYAVLLSRWIAALAAAAAAGAVLRWLPATRAAAVEAQQRLLFAAVWVGLGVLSSIGMGSGLHTFVLYLAPKATRYVLASWECGAPAEMRESRWALFPQFECPASGAPPPTVLSLLAAMQLEGLLWGLGTSLGELPPFLISRSARLAREGAAPAPAPARPAAPPAGGLARALAFFRRQLRKSPFLTILLLASFPNPFFDACGLVCGYNLVPFWLFFSATLLGKAVVKVPLQLLLVVALFSKGRLDGLLALVEQRVYPALGGALRRFVERQRRELVEGRAPGESSLFSQAWNTLLLMVVLFYAVTLVNARVARFHAAQQKFN